MFSLKGFLELDGFANNKVGQTAVLGELSSRSMTYAKDKGYYYNTANQELRLVAFSCKQDDTPVTLPDDIATNVFKVLEWTYTQILNNTNLDDAMSFIGALTNELSSQVSSVELGTIVNDTEHTGPEWISWQIPNTENYIRIWLSDAAFSTQYDEYEIIVIPPIKTMDDFFSSSSVVKGKLNGMTIDQMVTQMQLAKDNYPETIVKIETYNYVDPADNTNLLPTRWGLLIYGAAGDNIDSIKDALTGYILANSTHPRSDWIKILPDLFRRTEFIFTPVWDQYGIPNRVLEKGIYSPILTYGKALTVAVKTATEYTPDHVKTYLTMSGHPYKSLVMTIVGGPENRDGKYFLTDFYSDYISVPTTSLDFNRMESNTQEMAGLLADLIYQAESMNKYTVLPYGMCKLTRDGILYAAQTLNNIQFLVAAKQNFA